MAAFQTLTLKLTDTTTETITLTTASSPEANQAAMSVIKNGGTFTNSGKYVPATAIVTITIS